MTPNPPPRLRLVVSHRSRSFGRARVTPWARARYVGALAGLAFLERVEPLAVDVVADIVRGLVRSRRHKAPPEAA